MDLPPPKNGSQKKLVIFDMDETLIHCVDDIETQDPDVILEIDFPDEDLATCTVEKPEELEILGNKISCTKLRVERTDRKSKKTTQDFEWYAEGIGLVQVTVTVMKMTQQEMMNSSVPLHSGLMEHS